MIQEILMAELLEPVRAEIEELHVFFVEWFQGSCPDDDATFAERFSRRFAADFVLIPPTPPAQRLEQLSAAIRRGHGNNPDFEIEIRDVIVRQQRGGMVLATYEEWQRGARNTTPPENGRLASVWFERQPDGSLRWQHVHETTLTKG
jgi:hypothetical protein